MRTASILMAVLVSASLLAGCSESPSEPTPPPGSVYLGDWQGTVVSDEIGAGTILLRVTSEIAGPPGMLIAGTFSMTFTAHPLAPAGHFSGSTGSAPGQFGLFFDRSTMPCPGEPNGTADRALAAAMTVNAQRMTGRFVVAGCPGGSIDITKKEER